MFLLVSDGVGYFLFSLVREVMGLEKHSNFCLFTIDGLGSLALFRTEFLYKMAATGILCTL